MEGEGKAAHTNSLTRAPPRMPCSYSTTMCDEGLALFAPQEAKPVKLDGAVKAAVYKSCSHASTSTVDGKAYISDVLTLVLTMQVESMEVESLTVRQMLQQHDISDVLVVLIDTEGFDWQVIYQVALK